jgi:arylsulfatase A-like enzyme
VSKPLTHITDATRRFLPIALTFLLVPPARADDSPPRPHIVCFLADDLGWKDIGYHGSDIKTPHLDRLAAAGAKLEQFYVMPVCSPTRAALMTGRYPMRTGLQTGVVRPWARYGLPLDERTLAQALKEAGYETAITGKWHLGHFEPDYLPTRRGFDHQYGHYNGAIDYFDHTREGGLDWHRDGKALREDGYSTDLIGAEAVRLIKTRDTAKPLFLYVPFNAPHAPLQAPEEYVRKYAAIKDAQRRKYAAMVTCLDDNVGRIVAALQDRGLAEGTLIVFSSDNGGPTGQGAANGELRGGKGGLYEGGIRVPAFAVWPGRIRPGTVVSEPLHMVDWYPTLARLAGSSLEQKQPLDGRDILPTIAAGKPTPHADILINVEPNQGALRAGPWKLIVHGKLPGPDGGRPERVELYNLATDVGETTNVAAKEPKRVEELLARLNGYAKEALPPKGAGTQNKPADFKAPAVWGEK